MSIRSRTSRRTLPTQRFHDRVHAGRLRGGEHDPDTHGAEHLVEDRGELGVAVTDQESVAGRAVAKVEHQVAGLLATHAPVGFAVTPRTWTRRLACSTTAKQYIRVRVIVSAGKKSPARIPSAWVRGNWLQLGPDRRGTGSMPAWCRIRQTVAAPTFRPRPASSPVILRYPQVGFSAARCSTSARIAGRVGGRPEPRLG